MAVERRCVHGGDGRCVSWRGADTCVELQQLLATAAATSQNRILDPFERMRNMRHLQQVVKVI